MTTADSALGSMKAVLTWDVSDRLGQIQAKTLIVVGEGDRIVSPAEGEAAARRIRRAQLLRLEAAHHPNDEIPDVFHPLLASFLSEGDAI